MVRFNYTHSGKKIEDVPENERTLMERRLRYTGNEGEALADFAPHIKRRRDKNRAKNRVARKSRRRNR